jgi:predicted acylesterase/phospholipase RssA
MRLLKTCELYRVPSGCFSMNDISSTTPPNTLRQRRPLHTGRPDRCDRVALVLQGGGALGAYQAGVYQAMHEADIMPDWVAGVSIGAINAAIIAGNPPHRRIAQLHAFWDLITEHKIWAYTRTATCSAERATRRAQ